MKDLEGFTLLKAMGHFPGGTVVKNPPTNAGDTGLIPGLGRPPHAAEQGSLCATTTESVLYSLQATTAEPVHLEPMVRNKRSHRNEKPVPRNEE